MRARMLAVWLCAVICGCKCVPTVNVHATARVQPEMPVSNPGPVVAQTVAADHGAKCNCEDCLANTPKVAVIDVDGLMVNSDMTGLGSAGENPVALFRERLDAAADDPCVRAVVLRINSPGGGVTATDIMWHDLRRFREKTNLPVVTCILDVGTGGAYYLSTASDYIIAHPTSVTGGIGVIMNLYDFSMLMEHYQILSTPVKAGANIDLGTPLRAMSDEKRELLQKMADDYHKMFIHVVEDARPDIDPSNATNFDGRVFTSTEAVERRLIDEVGYLDDAVGMAKRLGGVSSARVVLFHRCGDRARTPYAVTPNVPLQTTTFPISIPALERSKMPAFMYLWQPEPTMEKMAGR